MTADLWRYRREDLDDQVNGIAYEATGEIPAVILSTDADRGALGRLKSARFGTLLCIPGLPSFLDSMRHIVCDRLL